MTVMTKAQFRTSGSAVFPPDRLSPSQRKTYETLRCLVSASPAIALGGEPGTGKTAILRALAVEPRVRLLTRADYMAASRRSTGDDIEVAVGHYIAQALAECDLLLLDDLQGAKEQFRGKRGMNSYFIWFDQLLKQVEAAGKCVVISGRVPRDGESWAGVYRNETLLHVETERLGPKDYRAIVANSVAGGSIEAIDFERIFRFAPGLNGNDLTLAAKVLPADGDHCTEDLIDALSEFRIRSNTRTQEVEDIRFETMPGIEHLVEELERNIILPLQNRDLAFRLNLEAKRGVLLYGPPGTGKTSIGRALARRMEGRFFLIDGSVNTEPPWDFYAGLEAIVRDAKENAPCVLFIDDADVLFGIEHIAGFGRYMLSLLDGIRSVSSAQVCVMMTAMDASKIPDALIRSGRVELWLETTLPERATRAAIFRRWLGEDLPGHDALDADMLADKTEGFTPADIRRVIADARSTYVYAQVHGRKLGDATHYIAEATDRLIAMRGVMAEALADETLRIRL